MDYFDKLAQARTPEEAHTALLAEARDLGAAHVSHRCGASAKKLYISTSLPRAWMSYYRDERFGDVDPGPRVAAMTDAPVAFHFEEEHPEIPVKVDLSKEAMKMFGELKGADVRATFFTPMPGKKRQPLSMVSFYSNESPRRFKAWVDAHQCRLRLLGAAANARIIDMLADSADAKDRLLGPREREALSWLASGHRIDRIAEKMNVSGRTVEFHLKNARAKLGARTREEALARAILSGEVEL